MAARRALKLSREELYKRIWGQPLRVVAHELGLSDVGLAKLCRRNGIPTPPQGFHLMKPGLRKDRLIKPLPAAESGQCTSFTFHVADEPLARAREVAKEATARVLAERRRDVTAAQLRAIDAELRRLRGRLKPKHLDERGMIRPPERYFPIRVSPTSLKRATAMLRALFVKLVAHGAILESPASSEANDRLCVRWEGYGFGFRIEESSRRVEVPPEKRPRPLDGYAFPGDAWRLVPTGTLTLSMSGPGYETWSLRDGRRVVEERLDELIERIYVEAATQREEDRLKAERKARAIAYLQEQDKRRQEQAFQESRRKQLAQEARRWRRAQALRDYIVAVERAGFTASRQSLESEAAWQKWVEWAKRYINSLDPITRGEAGATPPYPEPRAIKDVPGIYLDYDDPAEADRELQRHSYWWHR